MESNQMEDLLKFMALQNISELTTLQETGAYRIHTTIEKIEEIEDE